MKLRERRAALGTTGGLGTVLRLKDVDVVRVVGDVVGEAVQDNDMCLQATLTARGSDLDARLPMTIWDGLGQLRDMEGRSGGEGLKRKRSWKIPTISQLLVQ
jgi:hypothetical protein